MGFCLGCVFDCMIVRILVLFAGILRDRDECLVVLLIEMLVFLVFCVLEWEVMVNWGLSSFLSSWKYDCLCRLSYTILVARSILQCVPTTEISKKSESLKIMRLHNVISPLFLVSIR